MVSRFDVDRMLYHVNADAMCPPLGTDLAKYGLPTELKSADDLQQVMDGMKPHCLDLVNIWEYYVVKVSRDAQAAVDAW